MLIPWRDVAITPDSTLKRALQQLNESGLQIALVVDDQQRLLGTLTDGDIRRALLHDVPLTELVTKAMNASPITGLESEHSLAWRQRLQGHGLRHLPVINDDGKVVGLYYDRPVVMAGLPYPVVLMLGGLGTRLRPLTKTVPKPMLKVGNRPILEHILESLIGQGFVEFYFCINYLGHMIRDYFGDGSRWGVRIHYVEESKRMGTAGALSLLPQSIQMPFLVMNGDLLTKVDFKALVAFHQQQRAVASVCMREHEYQVPYGVIELDGDSIQRIVEKPVHRCWVSAGIYVLSPQALSYVPANEFFDMPELLDKLIADHQSVSGYRLQDYWLDIGRMPDFEQAQTDYDVHFQHKEADE